MIFVFGIFVFFVLLLLRNRAVVDIFTPGMMLVFLFLVVVLVRRVLPEANALDVARVAVVVVNAAVLCIFALLLALYCITLRVKFK